MAPRYLPGTRSRGRSGPDKRGAWSAATAGSWSCHRGSRRSHGGLRAPSPPPITPRHTRPRPPPAAPHRGPRGTHDALADPLVEELLPQGQRVLLHRGHTAASMAGPGEAAAGKGRTAKPAPPARSSLSGTAGNRRSEPEPAGPSPAPPSVAPPLPVAPPTASGPRCKEPAPKRARQAPPPARHWLRGLNEAKLIGRSAARRALIG